MTNQLLGESNQSLLKCCQRHKVNLRKKKCHSSSTAFFGFNVRVFFVTTGEKIFLDRKVHLELAVTLKMIDCISSLMAMDIWQNCPMQCYKQALQKLVSWGWCCLLRHGHGAPTETKGNFGCNFSNRFLVGARSVCEDLIVGQGTMCISAHGLPPLAYCTAIMIALRS